MSRPGGARAARRENLLTFPHDATGLNALRWWVRSTTDKIIVGHHDLPDWHLTLHAGFKSGVLDVHETTGAPDGPKTHRTLFAVEHAELERLFAWAIEDGEAILRGAASAFRPLRLGWMRHRYMEAQRLPHGGEEDALEALTFIGRKKRAKLSLRRVAAEMPIAECVTDLLAWPDGGFAIRSTRRRDAGRIVGVGIKVTNAHGRAELFWARQREMARASAEVWGPLEALLQRGSTRAAKHQARMSQPPESKRPMRDN